MRAWRGLLATALLVTALESTTAVTASTTSPELMLFNGKIFTSDAGQPYVQALAVLGERIIAMGDSGEIAALAGTATRRIDLGGRTVIPGVNDAHNHVDIHPANLVEVELQAQNPTSAGTWRVKSEAFVTLACTGSKG